MSVTAKIMTQKDADQSIKNSYNDVNSTLGVDGFLVGLVGRRVTQTITTTTVANDTSVFAFSENGTPLYTITVVYTDASQNTMISATRTA